MSRTGPTRPAQRGRDSQDAGRAEAPLSGKLVKREPLPRAVLDFKSKYPKVWDAFAALGERCHESGPLDEKTRRLVKLGIAIALRHEGAVHSAARNALSAGITPAEMFHAAILSVTTIGWPAANAAMSWINDIVSGAGVREVEADRF